MPSLRMRANPPWAPRIWLGREREIAACDEALDALVAGRGGVLLACGEAGIGKTRLADEVGRRAEARGVEVHWGRAWEVGGAPSFWCFSEVLREMWWGLDDRARADVSRVHGAHLAEVLPEAARDGAPTLAEGTPRDRLDLFEAVASFLRLTAARAPRLVVLDDLHAVDPSSLSLLRFLAPRLRRGRVLLLGTFRDAEARLSAELRPLLAQVAREATVLPLRRLDHAEVADFIAQTRGVDPTPAEVEALHQRSEGNPLFLREALALTVGAAAPESVGEVVRARLALLPPRVRGALEVAAVLGREFDLDALSALLPGSRPDLDAALDLARAATVVEPMSAAGRWRFTHVLLREGLYESLPPPERAALHALAAERLGRAGDEALSEVAHHLRRAIPRVPAVDAARADVRAAERAMRVLAYEDAASLLEDAASLLSEVAGAEEERVEALIGLGLARIHCADLDRGKRACAEAAALARALGDGGRFARAVLTSAYEFTPGVRDEELLARLDEALSMLGPAPSALRARCLAQLAAERLPAPDPARSVELAREAVAMARALGDDATLRQCLSAAGLAMLVVAEPEERLAVNREALSLAFASGDKLAALRAHLFLGLDRAELGDLRGARAHHREVEAAMDAFRHDRFGWLRYALRCIDAMDDGRFDDAWRHHLDARDRAGDDPSSGTSQAAFPAVFFLVADRDGDDPGQAAAMTQAALGRHGDDLTRCLGDVFAAEVWARAGDRERAAASLAAVRVHPSFEAITEASWLARLAEPCLVLGDAQLAARVEASVRPRAGRFHVLGPLGGGCDAPFDRYLGLAAQALGRVDDAVAHLSRAELAASRAGLKSWLARLRLELARALILRAGAGDAARASSLLGEARALAASLGQSRVVREVDALRPGSEPARVAAPAAPEAISLTRDGDVWTVAWNGATARVRDTRGVRTLARLVAHPDVEFHVLQLAGDVDGPVDAGDAGELLDDASVDAYRRRLSALREDLDEAESFADLARAARAREEIDALTAELSAAVGLGGRRRRAAAAADRARTAVFKRVQGAIRRVAEVIPDAGDHLDRAVTTGAFCVYAPGGRRRGATR